MKTPDLTTRTAYINGILLDGTENMQSQDGLVIITEGKKIVSIELAATANLVGCRLIDLGGKYIMPGLINLHVHLAGTGKPSKKKMDLVKICRLITSCAPARKIGCDICASNARTSLMAGITTVRAVGGISDFDTRIRNDFEKGKRIGPRLLPADCGISVPGGHMAGSFACEVHSAEEAREAVNRIHRNRPALIKLMVTGGILDGDNIGEPGVLRMPPEYIKAACDRAHELGYKVAAHCEGQAGVRAALQNGVDSIEHGAKPDEEIIRLMKEHGACQVVTLTPAIPYSLRLPGVMNLTEAAVINSNIVVSGMVEMAKTCLKEGIPVGLGTDSSCSFATHYDLWRELLYFTQYCGVSNTFALHTATLINARIAGVDSITGSIETGKSADMIVTEKNPLDDLSALRNVEMVVFEGTLYNHPVVKKIPEVEAALDSIGNKPV